MTTSDSDPRPGAEAPSTIDDDTARALSRAPLPTRSTLRMRQSLPMQAYRFVVLNAKIMRIVLKGHG